MEHLFRSPFIVNVDISQFLFYRQWHLAIYSIFCLFLTKLSIFHQSFKLYLLSTPNDDDRETDVSEHFSFKKSWGIDQDQLFVWNDIVKNLFKNVKKDVFSQPRC